MADKIPWCKFSDVRPLGALFMTTEEKQKQITQYVANLSARFNEILWDYPSKVAKLARFKPSFKEDFWKRWDELDKRFREYLDGKIEWEAEPLYVTEVLPGIAGFDYDHTMRDVVGCAVDLLAFVLTETKSL